MHLFLASIVIMKFSRSYFVRKERSQISLIWLR